MQHIYYWCLANLKTTQNPEMYLNEYKVAGCIYEVHSGVILQV